MKYAKNDRKTGHILARNEPYQGDRLAAALPFVRARRHAIDAGAHVGLWTVQLIQVFNQVTAFEPHPDNLAALMENANDHLGVTVFPCALGAQIEKRKISGFGLNAHVDANGSIDVDILTIDSLGCAFLDFLKIDVEGFETFVLLGGEKTIRREKPVIVLEQKHEYRYGLLDRSAVKLLQRWGAVEEWRNKRDHCLRWR